MKTLLSFILVVLLAGAACGQAPVPAKSKFGMGPGQFGDFSRAVQMHRQMRSVLVNKDKPRVGPPGPPPWAGQGMRRGLRGPQPPFQGPRFEGRPGPKGPGANLRGGDFKREVSGYHHRGGEWGHNRGHKHSHSGVEKQKHRGNYKNSHGKKSCCCKDCPRNK